ncbi:hypothetical protein CDIOL_43460 [Clostridium diolis]|uniref:Uncharacterized protein n=1 Tax=Clostridium diolis TaxID=223919 RepID=A0AAV3W560_9CLOT|nr:hypothetical protein CDIOL_43460 [Clostridium diolis]
MIKAATIMINDYNMQIPIVIFILQVLYMDSLIYNFLRLNILKISALNPHVLKTRMFTINIFIFLYLNSKICLYKTRYL